MSKPPPMPPTFLDKLSKKIAELRNPDHKFIILSSGTAFQINKEILMNYPAEQRGELNRSLLLEWAEGKQTLSGLKGIIKDQVLVYREGRPEKIKEWIVLEREVTTRYAVVPDVAFEYLNACAQSFFLKESQCLFLD
jgi:hypothetical protein